MSVSSAFDVDSRTITYTVTVSNTGDVALTGVTFLIPPGAEAGEGASSSTGLNGFESAREGESYESFEITDLPADFDLAVGASASFTFTHELVIQPTDGTPVTVGFTVSRPPARPPLALAWTITCFRTRPTGIELFRRRQG